VTGQAKRSPQHPGDPERQQHHDDDCGDSHPAEPDDVDQAELQPEQHDADTHEAFSRHREPGRPNPLEQRACCGQLRHDDSERYRRCQQRDGGNQGVNQPGEQGCRCGSKHPGNPRVARPGRLLAQANAPEGDTSRVMPSRIAAGTVALVAGFIWSGRLAIVKSYSPAGPSAVTR
jgi:hypothetical protein